MKITLINLPHASPVAVFRGGLPAHYLRERGHEVIELAPGCSRAVYDNALLDSDVLWFVFPGCDWSEGAKEFEGTRAAVVVDGDDNMWAWEDDPASKEAEHVKLLAVEGAAGVTREKADRFASWLRNADVVTTTTPALASIFRNHGAREVHVCANALAPGMFVKKPEPRPASVMDKARGGWKGGRLLSRPGRKRVAWTGSIAHKADLPPVLLALRRIAAIDGAVDVASLGPVDFTRMPEWSGAAVDYRRAMFLRASGKDERGNVVDFWTAGEVTAAKAAEAEAIDAGMPTVPFEAYYQTLAAMAPTVAVIPMRESPFNAGKSPVTLYSWAAQGVPVVCSRTGPYAEAEREGFPALYVDHEDVSSWVEAVRSLLYDAERAAEIGKAAHDWVREKATFPGGVEAWERAFDAAVERRRVTA